MGCISAKNSSKHFHNPSTLTTEKEGWEGRILRLYHSTSSDSAQLIIKSHKMLRGQSGMFGAGIYFAESEAIATHKAKATGAMITADVVVGVSLVCRQAEPRMDINRLRTCHQCHSVKGVGCVSNPEYVVFSFAQVSIVEVQISGSVYYSAPSASSLFQHCSDEACMFYDELHIGACRVLCRNPACEFFQEAHLGGCSAKCTNGNCVNFGESHAGNCKEKCRQQTCENFGQFHTSACRAVCQNKKCINTGRYHAGNCTVPCIAKSCVMSGQVHLGACKLRCANSACSNHGSCHDGACILKPPVAILPRPVTSANPQSYVRTPLLPAPLRKATALTSQESPRPRNRINGFAIYEQCLQTQGQGLLPQSARSSRAASNPPPRVKRNIGLEIYEQCLKSQGQGRLPHSSAAQMYESVLNAQQGPLPGSRMAQQFDE